MFNLNLNRFWLCSAWLSLAWLGSTWFSSIQIKSTWLSSTQLDSVQPGLTWLDSAQHNSRINISLKVQLLLNFSFMILGSSWLILDWIDNILYIITSIHNRCYACKKRSFDIYICKMNYCHLDRSPALIMFCWYH